MDKPRYGMPCNGCGLCCRLELCPIAIKAFGADHPAPCPVLIERDGRTWCGAIEEAEKMNVAFAAHWKYMLGVGAGCLVDDDVIAPSTEEWWQK